MDRFPFGVGRVAALRGRRKDEMRASVSRTHTELCVRGCAVRRCDTVTRCVRAPPAVHARTVICGPHIRGAPQPQHRHPARGTHTRRDFPLPTDCGAPVLAPASRGPPHTLPLAPLPGRGSAAENAETRRSASSRCRGAASRRGGAACAPSCCGVTAKQAWHTTLAAYDISHIPATRPRIRWLAALATAHVQDTRRSHQAPGQGLPAQGAIPALLSCG